MQQNLEDKLADSTNFDLELTNQEYLTLKRLHGLGNAFAQLELTTFSIPEGFVNAVNDLEDLGIAFEHYDKQPQKRIMFPGQAVVLLARPSAYMQDLDNQTFMRSLEVVSLIQKMQNAMQQQKIENAK